MRNLLGWNMIILPLLTTSLIHFSLKGWQNMLFELGSGRGKHILGVFTAACGFSLHFVLTIATLKDTKSALHVETSQVMLNTKQVLPKFKSRERNFWGVWPKRIYSWKVDRLALHEWMSMNEWMQRHRVYQLLVPKNLLPSSRMIFPFFF